MPSDEARFQCRHILADGRRCRAACLRHEEFCYYHHASRKPAARPAAKPGSDANQPRKSRRDPFTLPRIEDNASVLAAVNQIVALIAANEIDPRRAGRLLYAIQIARTAVPRPAALKPVDADPDAIPDLVEEVVAHPTYGDIAPRYEFTVEEPDLPRKSLAQSLREEMEALEARNIAQFGASADDAHVDDQVAEDIPPQAPIHNQINDLRADLHQTRQLLASANAELAKAAADTLHAEEVMVWHMDRHAEARAELDALKPQPAPQPATLDRLQAVAASERETLTKKRHLDRTLAMGGRSFAGAPPMARPWPWVGDRVRVPHPWLALGHGWEIVCGCPIHGSPLAMGGRSCAGAPPMARLWPWVGDRVRVPTHGSPLAMGGRSCAGAPPMARPWPWVGDRVRVPHPWLAFGHGWEIECGCPTHGSPLAMGGRSSAGAPPMARPWPWVGDRLRQQTTAPAHSPAPQRCHPERSHSQPHREWRSRKTCVSRSLKKKRHLDRTLTLSTAKRKRQWRDPRIGLVVARDLQLTPPGAQLNPGATINRHPS